jgi:SAM-dependent methyltransferase
MRLEPHHIERLEAFLNRIQGETYPEAPSSLHTDVTARMLDRFFTKCKVPQGAAVLDVGCGQGVALEYFAARGLQATGIALNEVDVTMCRRKGHNVFQMDQSFLDFPDSHFDMIWCRHCLEHSFSPLFTLFELTRVLKPGGYLYVEVPAPDTSCRHQTNPNHYSVLGKSMWTELFRRTGLCLLEALDINFVIGAGPDLYFAFITQRRSA